jgi:hypothetical protein
MRNWLKSLLAMFKREDSSRNESSSATHSETPTVAIAVTPEPAIEAYSSDLPITSKEEDRFGRWPFAERIAETIAKREDPSSLVIGLYGPWGDGKTSTLQMMRSALQPNHQVVVVPFNPWHFGSEPQLLKGFFATLSAALGQSLSTWTEKMGGSLDKYGSLLSLASVNIAHMIEVNPGNAVKGIGAALSSVELEELRSRVETFLKDQRIRVVVLIDDIDRLDREETHAIFKLVKLSASFQYTTFVLAFDDEMVAAALGERYGGGGATAGRHFLEKIVQVPLHLPPPDDTELRHLTFEGVDAALNLSGIRLSREQVEEFARHFVDGISPRLQTPRQAKLYGNALAFSLPLLRGEAYPVDLMLIEGIRIFYPKLYAAIRDNPDRFLKGPRDSHGDQPRNDTMNLINTALEGIGLQERDLERIRTRLLAAIFPRLGASEYGSEWEAIWAKRKRICSSEYFQRYFSYSIPPGDVSDSELAEFLEGLTANAPADAGTDEQFASWAKRRAMPRVISKLRQFDSLTNPSVIRNLAIAIVRNSIIIPREDGMMSIGGTYTEAAILVSQLIKKLPMGDARASTMTGILQTNAPLVFKFECWRWLRHSSDESEESRVFSVADESQLERLLADQISASATVRPLYEQFDHSVPALLWLWSTIDGTEAVAGAVHSWIHRSDDDAVRLLGTYLGRSWGMESGLSRRSDFSRESYDSVAAIISPAQIYERLKSVYGDQITDPQFYQDDDTPDDLQIARQFAFIHEAVARENSSPPPSEVT